MKKLQQKYNAFSCAFHMGSLNVSICPFSPLHPTTHPRTVSPSKRELCK